MRRGAIRNEIGLTMLELVLALSISALLMVLVFSALRLGYKASERAEARQDYAQRVRIISERIFWLISGAYPYRAKKQENDSQPWLYFDGSEHGLSFVTTSTEGFSDKPYDKAGIKRVEINVKQGAGLRFMEGPVLLPAESAGPGLMDERVFDQSVRKIKFSYLDRDDEGKETWLNEWDVRDRDYLPIAVKVEITIAVDSGAGQKEEALIPLPEIFVTLRTGGVR